MGEWGAEIIETPRDGSCFFTSIAIAMNDSVEMWCSIDELRTPMEKYWERYLETCREPIAEVTPDLVRFMCAQNIDEDILTMFNEEANYRRTTQKVNAKMFKTKEQLGRHMMKKSTWGDQASLRAFVKSLDFQCAVIIFDDRAGGMIRLPEEWTKDKKAYICLKRERNHYNLIRLSSHRYNLPLCVTREFMLDLLKNVYGDKLKEKSEIPVF